MDKRNSIIGIYAKHVNGMVSRAAKAIALGGYKTYLIVKEKLEYPHMDHTDAYPRLKKDGSINVIEPGERLSIDFAKLYLFWSYSYRYGRDEVSDVKYWSGRAKRLGALCYQCYYGVFGTLGNELKDLLKMPGIAFRFRDMGYEEECLPFDIYSLWSRKYHLGIGPHPQFIHDKADSDALFEQWDPSKKRPYRFNFMGSVDTAPTPRGLIINDIASFVRKSGCVRLVQEDMPIQENSVTDDAMALWYVDSPPYTLRPRTTSEYIRRLTGSDFTLCPMGGSPWTHRVVEALARGSIPVLEDATAPYYDVGLEDGINCILVKKNGWIASLDRIINMKTENIIAMRHNIFDMREKCLLPGAESARLRKKMALA